MFYYFFHIASMLPQRLCVAVYILYSNICEHIFKYPFIPYIDFNFLIFAGKKVHFERKIMYIQNIIELGEIQNHIYTFNLFRNCTIMINDSLKTHDTTKS